MVGLFGGTAIGSTGAVTFAMYADNSQVINQTFASGAAAASYFSDHAIDLGSLATGPLEGDELYLRAVLTVSSATVGACFYAGLIIGDPPPGPPAATTQQFSQAMASVGASNQAVPTQKAQTLHQHLPLLAHPSHAAFA
jgi:hypothetical protein